MAMSRRNARLSRGMATSLERGRVQHTPRRRGLPCAWLALCLGCAGAATPAGETAWNAEGSEEAASLRAALAASEAPLDAGALRVRLIFGGAADLDLYVSDPLAETVYYANTPSASGGALTADRRCGDPAPRVEQVEFVAPPAGRYRVGVDFPERCGRGRDPVVYVLEVRSGVQRVLHSAIAWPIRFDPAVAEIDLAP